MAAEAGMDPAAAQADVRVTARRYLKAIEQTQDTALDQDSWLESAAEIGVQSRELREALSQVNRAFGIKSGRDAILLYLRKHVGQSVPADALAGVACIAEWARRVRELRVEYGWPIESGVTRDDMPHDHYVLTSDQPDEELAERWRLATFLRKQKGSGKSRIARRCCCCHQSVGKQRRKALRPPRPLQATPCLGPPAPEVGLRS